MSQTSVITPEMRSAIGVESEPYVFEVEKGDIIRYAQAIRESNPLFRDEVAARRSRFGGIIAPPTYLIVMRILESEAFDRKVRLDIPFTRSVDGGSQWRYYEPVRPGDRITATKKLVDLHERQGNQGRMLFKVSEITYRNQFGQVVMVQRDTAIYY